LFEVYLVQKPCGLFYKLCKFEVIQIDASFVAKQTQFVSKLKKEKLFLPKKYRKEVTGTDSAQAQKPAQPTYRLHPKRCAALTPSR
jgi:hypothetical protein